MLTSSQIARYGILECLDHYSTTDELFSGEDADPYMFIENNAGRNPETKFYDITVAICEGNKCIVQIVVFRNKEGYELYKKDKVVIFNQSEL